MGCCHIDVPERRLSVSALALPLDDGSLCLTADRLAAPDRRNHLPGSRRPWLAGLRPSHLSWRAGASFGRLDDSRPRVRPQAPATYASASRASSPSTVSATVS